MAQYNKTILLVTLEEVENDSVKKVPAYLQQVTPKTIVVLTKEGVTRKFNRKTGNERGYKRFSRFSESERAAIEEFMNSRSYQCYHSGYKEKENIPYLGFLPSTKEYFRELGYDVVSLINRKKELEKDIDSAKRICRNCYSTSLALLNRD